MKNKKQKTMLPSKIISALIAGLLGISSMATADVSDNEQQQSRVEEIVVTASKREESIMDVAQSVQYMSGEQLEDSGVQTLAEIVQLIPGVSQIGASAETYFNFRGTGANLANDSPVGFYIDGMPYYIVDSPVGPDTEMFDLESIQVLRGPQGTLYGQGALGGTVCSSTRFAIHPRTSTAKKTVIAISGPRCQPWTEPRQTPLARRRPEKSGRSHN